VRGDQSPGPESPNGFQQTNFEDNLRTQSISDGSRSSESNWQDFGLATIVPSNEGLRTATDDWPFLYLRKPMIPTLSLRGMIIMGLLSLVLIFLFLPNRQKLADVSSETNGRRSLNIQLFFLGAGFMLVETKAVVTMALLFGSTWVVNSVVFFAVLVMILLANYWTLKFKPARFWPYYVGLLLTLALNTAVPLDYFLGMNRSIQVAGACVLVFTPILFAAIIFATTFNRTNEPDRALGINIAGAMAGGLAEYSSMLLGFQYLAIVAMLFYVLSTVGPARENNLSASDRLAPLTPTK
jgi:hypothetical protein